MKFKEKVYILLITALISVIANWLGPGISPLQGIPGVLILALISVAGIGISEIMPGKIPAVAYIVTLATLVTIPAFPLSSFISYHTGNVDFTTLCTPILAYAGIYTGENLDNLKKTGPKIIILAIFVILGTYIGSAIIAQLILKAIGQI
uniref:DUF340 domain-containing protein n=1 Tax=Anaerococcus mediterraneensis TaxID=1870984 RepID=UPI0009316C35|nr:DUF340 domain-containing protein [Anaerococcus mediterraneensis]